MTSTIHCPQAAKAWPWTCSADELATLLALCSLSALRRLVLRRPHAPVWTLSGDFCHDVALCRQQLDAVRAVLPADAKVLCGTCDHIEWKCFDMTIFGMW